jgi:hypothetical protein
MRGDAIPLLAGVVDAAAKLPCKAALIDGELIVQDENGISDFDACSRRSTRRRIGSCSSPLISCTSAAGIYASIPSSSGEHSSGTL